MTQEADVLVIGAGIAGASLAYRLARRLRVTVLEAEPAPGYHASGRSATHYNLGVGRPPVVALTRLSRRFFLEPPADFRDVPLATRCPGLTVARDGQLALLDGLMASLDSVGVQGTRLSAADLARQVPILRTGQDALVAGVLDPEGHRLDVHALLQGYLRGTRREGGDIVTGAEARSIRRADGRWTVDTPRGRFRAPVLVNAAGAWADAVARLAGVAPLGLQPLRRTVVTFNLPAPLDPSGWPFVKCVQEHWYFAPEAGGLLLSPADETPSEPVDAQPDEYDIAVAVDRFEANTTVTVARLTAAWAGLRTFAPDRLPVVGQDPEAPGFFWLAGQGGAGLQTSPKLSRCAAALLLDEPFPDDVLEAGLSPATFAPGRLRAA